MKENFSLFSVFHFIWVLETWLIEDCSLQDLVCFSAVKDGDRPSVVTLLFSLKSARIWHAF